MSSTYTVKQVASILGYSTNSIYTFLKEKRIKGVRVGKGRFRIPQAELDRLLGDKRPVLQTANNPEPQNILPRPVETQNYFLFPTPGDRNVHVPSLFVWFLGLSSVILGFSYFLFPQIVTGFQQAQYSVWLSLLRFVLVGGGIGILLSDIFARKKTTIQVVLKVVLMACYEVLAYLYISQGNWVLATLPAVLATLITISIFLPNHDSRFSALCFSFVFLLIPVVVIASEDVARVYLPEMSARIFFAAGWFIGTLLITALFWRGIRNESYWEYWCGGLTISIVFFGTAFLLAYQNFWGYSLVLVLAGLSVLSLPTWSQLEFSQRRDRRFVFMLCGSIGILMLIALGIVRLSQTTILDYAQQELDDKSAFGKFLVLSSLESAKLSIENGAANSQLGVALSDSNSEESLAILRLMYESRSNFRRLVIYSANDARVIANYPLSQEASDETSNFQYFFARTAQEKKTQISDTYSFTGTHAPIVVIASPVLRADGSTVGVLAGYIDLDTLTLKLGQLATEEKNEKIVLLDQKGNTIDRGNNAEYKYVDRKESLLESSVRLSNNNWIVRISVPKATVLQSTKLYAIILFPLLLVTVAIISVVTVSNKKRVLVADNTS